MSFNHTDLLRHRLHVYIAATIIFLLCIMFTVDRCSRFYSIEKVAITERGPPTATLLIILEPQSKSIPILPLLDAVARRKFWFKEVIYCFDEIDEGNAIPAIEYQLQNEDYRLLNYSRFFYSTVLMKLWDDEQGKFVRNKVDQRKCILQYYFNDVINQQIPLTVINEDIFLDLQFYSRKNENISWIRPREGRVCENGKMNLNREIFESIIHIAPTDAAAFINFFSKNDPMRCKPNVHSTTSYGKYSAWFRTKKSLETQLIDELNTI